MAAFIPILYEWFNGSYGPLTNTNTSINSQLNVNQTFGVGNAQDLATFNSTLDKLNSLINSPSQNEEEITVLNNWVQSNPNHINNERASLIIARANAAIYHLRTGRTLVS